MEEMTDNPDHVVIPYSRFLECLERRRPIVERPQPEPPTHDADVPPAPAGPHEPVTTAARRTS